MVLDCEMLSATSLDLGAGGRVRLMSRVASGAPPSAIPPGTSLCSTRDAAQAVWQGPKLPAQLPHPGPPRLPPCLPTTTTIPRLRLVVPKMAGDVLHARKLLPPAVLPVPLQPMVQAGSLEVGLRAPGKP